MKRALRVAPPDPFATLVNLMGAALAGTPTAGEPSTGKRRKALDDPPLPLRPQPPDDPAPPARPTRTRSLVDRLDDWAWRLRQRDLEASLTSASDIADLEARLRARERAAFHRYY